MFLEAKSSPWNGVAFWNSKLITRNMDLTNPLLYMAEVQLELHLNI